ncbi:uncharacterized protein PRCAT00001198001 [Priceomyces carsonii]|uniref:uncharacterized protein n=1 Tax=Priceomyces carsonii TaxID=28549 RepID=UPI002EDAC159|nr:unnamed protein product [Priceomyces carsonii]
MKPTMGEEDDSIGPDNDELVFFERARTRAAEKSEKAIRREINLILDHTAFVRGIGNIKRWFSKEYLAHNVDFQENELVHLNLYVPTYTLHEFEHVKKGFLMSAVNARESIRFINKFLEEKDTYSNDADEKGPIVTEIQLESPNQRIPSWNECLSYQIHSPKVTEFPHNKTNFELPFSSARPRECDDKTDSLEHLNVKNSFNTDVTNAALKSDVSIEGSNADAEIPRRLKYLVRSCIFKKFFEAKDTGKIWHLVTEDAITRIWMRSFNIGCLNLNEADLLIYKDYDVNQFRRYDPNVCASLNEDANLISSAILQHKVDTTKYAYTTPKSSKRNTKHNDAVKETPKSTGVKGITSSSKGIVGKNVKKEKFEAINYAPRTKGVLWMP